MEDKTTVQITRTTRQKINDVYFRLNSEAAGSIPDVDAVINYLFNTVDSQKKDAQVSDASIKALGQALEVAIKERDDARGHIWQQPQPAQEITLEQVKNYLAKTGLGIHIFECQGPRPYLPAAFYDTAKGRQCMIKILDEDD